MNGVIYINNINTVFDFFLVEFGIYIFCFISYETLSIVHKSIVY